MGVGAMGDRDRAMRRKTPRLKSAAHRVTVRQPVPTIPQEGSTMTKAQTAERTDATQQLRAMLPPGATVHTVLRHVSRSGMSRSVSLVIAEDGQPWDISYLAARAMGDRMDTNHGGIKIGGAGMDMGFALVYNLSATLYPDGFECIGEGDRDRWGSRCPSNDHSNGDRDYTPHHHRSGGYALRQEWL